MADKTKDILAYIFGCVFVGVLLGVAFFVPEPSEAQWIIFKTIIALAAAGIATVLSGSINIEIPSVAKGAGAVGVFLLVFFYNPAALVVKREPTDPKLKSKATYYVIASAFVVDLTKRMPTADHDSTEKFSEVVVERQDVLKKVGDQKEPFTLFFGTSGLAIDWEAVTLVAQAEYREFKRQESPFNPLKRNYTYVLHLEDMQLNQPVTTASRFTFWNAFQGEQGDWWAAEIRYPTENAFVTIVFPQSKPCLSIEVKERQGDASERKIESNPPHITKGGRVVYWFSNDLREGSKYIFGWKW